MRPIPCAATFRHLVSYPQIASLVHVLVLKEVKFFRQELKQLMTSMMKRDDFSLDAVFNTLCLFSNDPEIKSSG